MERMPVRKRGFSSLGVGVIERVEAASSRSAVSVAFLLFPSLQDMINERDVWGIQGGGRERKWVKIKRDQLRRCRNLRKKF